MGLPTKRLVGSYDTIIFHLTCSICGEILWKPVTCEECENSFCEICINQWLQYQKIKDGKRVCPFNCQYRKRKRISPLLLNLLSQLQFTCMYTENGCEEVLSYEALEQHELNCDYQILQCEECLSSMLKKYIIQHQTNSPCNRVQCEECKMKYKPQNKHDRAECLEYQIKKRNENFKQQQQQNSSIATLELPSEHNHQTSHRFEVTTPVDQFGVVYGILFIIICFLNYFRGGGSIILLLLDILIGSWSIYNSTHVSRQNNVANMVVAIFLGLLMIVSGIIAKTMIPTLIILLLSAIQVMRMYPYVI